MRPKNSSARDQLPALLRRKPGAKAAELAELAGVSGPTMLRMLAEVAGESAEEVMRWGRAGRTRYFLRRSLRGQWAQMPLYRIDAAGQAHTAGLVQLLAPVGTCLDVAAMGWPVDEEVADGLWPFGLPYPLQDMRPQGYLGRQFALRHAATLGVAPSPQSWGDDDVLHIVCATGTDTSGNLILGDMALQAWLYAKAQPEPLIADADVAEAYADLAVQASARGVPGSSAGGEFPKFTARRAVPPGVASDTPHVIVKFSGADASSTVQRWADLLVCEHLALQAAADLPGTRSARSRLLQHAGRTFLEVERFDRHGPHGRSALCSLSTLEAAIGPRGSNTWPEAAALLNSQGWLDADSLAVVQRLWWFGKLIANTDMHHGNLSLLPGNGVVQLAPTYDMLPMQYAPLAGGELPTSMYAPALPAPQDRAIWLDASVAALQFWRSAAADMRISEGFRTICAENQGRLEALHNLARGDLLLF
ncbi:type II toxin-antitoxin system HipA family toxin YjjJ [Rhodoferax sp. OV413]|uniref:type II toxin-antitoxin system HipA family toxin YjjJ n=1 Tax=Rhodoferax sp. OV413 TaxID=1855285 RepID=UPI0025CB7C22|nr:type II toxin-antitoxin system HipA family toxin YjjJ [Rhodoferax sp. OV413]